MSTRYFRAELAGFAGGLLAFRFAIAQTDFNMLYTYMPALSELAPERKEKLIDLLKAAGVDVSAWGKNYKRGKKYAALNPKYCYEWAFVQPRKVVVINCWHSGMDLQKGNVIIRESLNDPPPTEKYRKKYLKFQQAIKLAIDAKLPIRVIVIEGKTPGAYNTVLKRCLDPAIWRVTSYSQKTGDCILTRGPVKFVDQFSIEVVSDTIPTKHAVSTQAFDRSRIVRNNALMRAEGRCEWCNKPGFEMENGMVYLETHHVVPLSEHGRDREDNVAALCPNHHREAHHGAKRIDMRKKMLKQLSGHDACK